MPNVLLLSYEDLLLDRVINYLGTKASRIKFIGLDEVQVLVTQSSFRPVLKQMHKLKMYLESY